MIPLTKVKPYFSKRYCIWSSYYNVLNIFSHEKLLRNAFYFLQSSSLLSKENILSSVGYYVVVNLY